MKHIYIVVEGQSEEKFVQNILVPYFAYKNIFLTAEPVITGRSTKGKYCKGGGNSYKLYKNHIERLIKQFSNAKNYYFTTMIDLYALPTDFPKLDESKVHSDKYKLVQFLESSFNEDISARNFIPYIQLHEFETLMFHNLEKIADEFFDINVNLKEFQKEINQYDNLELINSSPSKAPSKRIDKYTNGQYCTRKVSASANILKDIDVDLLRDKYTHFNQWLQKIEDI